MRGPQTGETSSLGSVSLTPAAPYPLAWPYPPHAGEIQELQALGLFTLFICVSGKVKNIGASSHIESRAGSKGTSAEAHSSRTQVESRRKGGFHGHCSGSPQRGPLIPATQGQSRDGDPG